MTLSLLDGWWPEEKENGNYIYIPSMHKLLGDQFFAFFYGPNDF